MLLHRSTAPRHARPRRRVLVVGLLGGAAGAVLSAAPASAAPSGDPFAALRQCESGGDYTTNTGNGFYGAYQFDAQTWHSLGLSGLPSQAAPGTQDSAARSLQAQRGWEPWPACSASLGLSSYRTSAPTAQAAVPQPASAPQAVTAQAAAPTVAAAPAAVPDVDVVASQLPPRARRRLARHGSAGLPLFTVALVGQVRSDVRAWQRAMVARGWQLVVDGQYGPKSARATHDFEVQHGLLVEPVGIVGPQVRHTMLHTPTTTD
jgi:hypothetical protein